MHEHSNAGLTPIIRADPSNDWDEVSFTVDVDAEGKQVTVEIETEFDGDREAVYTTEVLTKTTFVPQSMGELAGRKQATGCWVGGVESSRLPRDDRVQYLM